MSSSHGLCVLDGHIEISGYDLSLSVDKTIVFLRRYLPEEDPGIAMSNEITDRHHVIAIPLTEFDILCEWLGLTFQRGGSDFLIFFAEQ